MSYIRFSMLIAECLCCFLGFIGLKKNNHLMCKFFCYMTYVFFVLYWIVVFIEAVIK